jgi:3-hydroxybutyryl-CoA dehydratase
VSAYLEDLETGAAYRSAGRTITEADIVNFAGVSGDFNALHTDETWVVENTPFRGRIAHGLLVLSASSGLPTPVLDELEVLAYAEVSRRMVGPVYPGDTIHAVYSVESTRPSRSRPGTGVATLAVEVLNQDGETVQAGTDVLIVAARPAEAE